MNLSRVRRRWLSSVLLVALLWMQWATTAHACRTPPVSTPTPDCAMHAGGATSPAGDEQSLPLCKAHCDQSRQAVNSAQAVGVDAPASMPALLAHPGVLGPAVRAVTPRELALPPGASPPGAPPIYIALRVLRN